MELAQISSELSIQALNLAVDKELQPYLSQVDVEILAQVEASADSESAAESSAESNTELGAAVGLQSLFKKNGQSKYSLRDTTTESSWASQWLASHGKRTETALAQADCAEEA